MVDPYLPPVGGVLWWIYKLRRRIQAPMEDFIMFEDPWVNETYQEVKNQERLGRLPLLRHSEMLISVAVISKLCNSLLQVYYTL